MPFSIGPFPNWLPNGTCPYFHSSGVSSIKVFLGYLGSLRFISLLSYSFKLPVVPNHAGLPSNELADSLAKTGVTLPLTYCMFPAHWPRSLQRQSIPDILPGDEIFLTTFSSTRFLRFPQRTGPSLYRPL